MCGIVGYVGHRQAIDFLVQGLRRLEYRGYDSVGAVRYIINTNDSWYQQIIDLSLEFGKPVTLGISGPGMTRLEANERIDYAKRAVESAIKLVQRLR